MAARVRWRGTTTQRALGASHQRERTAQAAALRDGDPCARCQQRGVYHPMFRWQLSVGPHDPRGLDLDDFPGRMYGGPQVKRLSARSCNRSAGATVGNQARGSRRGSTRPSTSAAPPLRTSRQW